MFEQMTAFVFAQIRPPRMADLAQSSAQRQMARGFLAYRKMMMIPSLWWDKQASRLPIDPHHFAFSAGIPHERVTLAGDNDDLSAGPVPVRFFIGTGLDGHDMTDHRISR